MCSQTSLIVNGLNRASKWLYFFLNALFVIPLKHSDFALKLIFPNFIITLQPKYKNQTKAVNRQRISIPKRLMLFAQHSRKCSFQNRYQRLKKLKRSLVLWCCKSHSKKYHQPNTSNSFNFFNR